VTRSSTRLPRDETETLSDVAFGNGVYLAVGSQSYFTSPDAMTWTGHNVMAGSFVGVIYTDRFVLLSFRAAATTTDGMKLNPFLDVAVSQSLTSIAFGNGKYVVVGSGVWVSPDASTWTSTQAESGQPFLAVAASDGTPGLAQFVASGLGKIYATFDGDTWQNVTPMLNGPNCRAAAQGRSNGMTPEFVVICGGFLYRSAFGSVWETRTLPAAGTAIVYAGGLYVMTTFSGAIYTSPDATTWTPTAMNGTAQIFTSAFQAIVQGLGVFVAVGDGGQIGVSGNGTSWTPASSGVTTPIVGVAVRDNEFVAWVTGAGYVLRSPNGMTWRKVDIGSGGPNQPVSVISIGYDGTCTFISEGQGYVFYGSDDSLDWHRLVAPAGAQTILQWASGSGKLVGVGLGNTIISRPIRSTCF